MKCIYCNHKETFVINSRATENRARIWRRRECHKCKAVFTTHEGSLSDNLFLIKRNGKRQRFIYEKLFASLFVVLDSGKERDNGRQAVLAKAIAEDIVKKIRSAHVKTVTTKEVIQIVHKELTKVSVHFADTYMLYSRYRRDILKLGSK